jgi:hypothetical protein
VRLTGSSPTIGGVSYVVASSAAISQAVSDYLTPLTSGQASQSTSSSSPSPANGTVGHHTLSTWSAVAATVPFPVEAPDYLPAGFAYFDRAPLAGQTYAINTGSGSQPALRVIYRDQSMDQFLGVSETSWVDAPLASPGTQVQAGGITYTVVGTEGKVDHVWWKKDGVLYWVSNTLSYLLPESELLKIAQSFMPVAKA